MDEVIDRLVVSVRADTASFARDVASMRSQLDGPLATGAQSAGKTIDNALAKAITTGKVGFDDLKKVALTAMSEIAQASLKSLFGSGSGVGGSGGLGGTLIDGLSSIISSLFGSPGRATGGPVSAGRPYIVGEGGPELFLPSSGGRVEQLSSGARDVRVGITIQSPAPSDPQVLRQSSRQVARAVRNALAQGR
jgi:phage-related minor tail protein